MTSFNPTLRVVRFKNNFFCLNIGKAINNGKIATLKNLTGFNCEATPIRLTSTASIIDFNTNIDNIYKHIYIKKLKFTLYLNLA